MAEIKVEQITGEVRNRDKGTSHHVLNSQVSIIIIPLLYEHTQTSSQAPRSIATRQLPAILPLGTGLCRGSQQSPPFPARPEGPLLYFWIKPLVQG